MRLITATVAALLLAFVPVAGAAPQAGEDYRVLSEAQPTNAGTVEVVEFFSYGCPHCFDFHPLISRWHDNAAAPHSLVRVPVTFGRGSWALMAQAYYVAQSLDALDITHAAMFDAIHVKGQRFDDAEAVADFYASLGLDRQAVLDAFDSFVVNMKMKRAERLVRDYRVRSTPSMAVAGRYVTSPSMAGGQDAMLDVVDYLMAERVTR